MAINNEPTIQPQTVTGIFTKYIAKTLPLAFDESMSYYECLCALLEYLNETIVPDINNTNAGLSELQEFYTDVQNYVNDYFENLDVQEEINNKLDDMIVSGQIPYMLEQIIGPIQEEYETNINNQIETFESSVNANITRLEQKVNSTTNGAPLVATSTSQMTDKTRIYVNTTDGKWYYYNGSDWVAGGQYQSTGIGASSVNLPNLSNFKYDFYRKETVDNYLWLPLTIYQGNYSEIATNVISSPCIRFYKGQTISINTDYTARLSLYNLDRSYISNTGNFATIENYTVTDDCLIGISISKESITTDDGNSTNVVTEIYNKDDFIQDIYKSFMKLGFRTAQKDWVSWSGYPRWTTMKYIHNGDKAMEIYLNNTNNIRYGINYFRDDDPSTFYYDTGWQTTQHTIIEPNSIFIIVLSYTDYATPDLNLLSAINIEYYEPEDEALTYGKHYNGEKIQTKVYGYNNDLLYSMAQSVEGINQALAIYNNIIFQPMSNHIMKLYDFTNGEFITSYEANMGHADNIEFSNTKYSEYDEFPLLYITTDYNPASIYVARVTRNSYETIRELRFPMTAGYYASQCCDFNNNIIYLVGYSNDNYTSDLDGANKMIVSAWDLSNLTLNEDGYTYCPAFIKSFTVPFITTCQGQRYFDNKIFIISSKTTYPNNTKIYVIDPFKEIVTNVLDDFSGLITDNEFEGIEFVKDDNNQYYMVLSSVNRSVWKITFEE